MVPVDPNLWERVRKLREEMFAAPAASAARSTVDPRASKSTADRNEMRMWMSIDRCEAALIRLVTEMEKLASLRRGEKQ